MKLQSKQTEGEHERRIYDDAKTPLQRVLLSGVLPDEIEQRWRKDIEALDPLRLVQHVEGLQQAIWRCTEGGFENTLIHFSLDTCASAAAYVSQREALTALAPVSPDPVLERDWSRSIDDPFLGEWEQIHAYVRARPMASAGEILREWQRRFPERFVDVHLSMLQRRLREMRASLVAPQTASPASKRKSVTASRKVPQPAQAVASLADTPTVAFADPVSASPSLLPPPEEETRPVLPAMMTIDHAINLFLQGKHINNWEPKTREWHETSLGLLRRYVAWRKMLLLSSLTSSELRGWLTFLRTETLVTGTFRAQSTISTYARSAHAWCAWLVEQGYLEQSPFARMPFPQGEKRPLRIIEQEVFDRVLAVCHATQTKQAIMTSATARNRAILWVIWDTGLLVSEACALNVEDVDLAQGTLHVQGSGPRERMLPLTPEAQQALTGYLAPYRLRAGKREASDPLFLSEQRARLTKNGFTQLFQRLCTRAGLEDRRLTPTMLREMFALRFLQTGGPPKALQRLLGLAECTPITRYLDAAGCSRRQRKTSENQRKA
jgi:integrase/recombinase XerD